MKKRLAILMAAIVALTLFAGCQKGEAEVSDSNDSSSISSSSTEDSSVSATVDKTVAVEGFDPAGYSNKIQTTSDGDFEVIYKNINELWEAAPNVVYGVVKEVTNFDESGTALVVYDFEVITSYKGELEKATLISVIGNGNYMRLSKYIELSGEGRFSDLSEEEIENTLLEDSFMGAPVAEVGDEFVLFLSNPIQEQNPFPAGAYCEVGGFMGKYFDAGNDEWTRHVPEDEPNFYAGASLTRSAPSDIYSFDELDSLLSNK